MIGLNTAIQRIAHSRREEGERVVGYSTREVGSLITLCHAGRDLNILVQGQSSRACRMAALRARRILIISYSIRLRDVALVWSLILISILFFKCQINALKSLFLVFRS